jgi:hypothetical protein
MTTLFENVANFMTVLFFPEIRRKTVEGGPVREGARKRLCFAANRLQFIRWDQPTSRQACLLYWGFFHLGRQTESEGIPNPRSSSAKLLH